MGETRLFVGNVPGNTSELELQSEFGHYGLVSRVEIKKKTEDENFAFVNIQIEERLVEKCIREFTQQQFKGNYLSVSRAKESFLERLKREREEAQKPPPPQATVSYKQEEDFYYKETYQPLPRIEKEVSSDESSSEEEEEIPKPAPVKKFVPKPTNGYARDSYGAPMDKATLDDIKRQESVQKLKDRHDEQRLAIKNALLSIDSTTPRNNKIVFEPPEPRAEKVEIEESQAKQGTKRKAQLFDGEDDEEEEEVTPDSFKVKKQFAGKNGEKLFELQTRFQNDKRFEIDEKFADDVEDTLDARKRYTREELKERKKMRKEMENWDQNEMKEERDNQLTILEGITGQSTGLLNSHNSKPAQIGMLRYDPSKKDHLKYLDLVKGDEANAEMNYDSSRNNNQNFEVSDEKFYKVSENLAQSLQNKTESKPFSIFEMLGVNHEDEPEEESKPEEVKVLTKLPAFNLGQVRFKYDSSDTDEEAEKTKAARKKKVVSKKSKGGKYSKSGVWRHNFFVADGDERLKEAFTFIKKSENVPNEAFDEKRKKLKQVIKSKIRKARSDQRRNETTSKKRKV